MSDDVIAVLTKDHREVEQMFAQAESAMTDPVRLKELAHEVTVELVRHSVAEEEYLYPFAKDRLPGGEQLVAEELEEHAGVEHTLKELEKMSGDNVEFASTFRSLMLQVRHHVGEEEGQLFPLMQREASPEELRKLGETIAKAKRVAPTHPHPSSPDTPPLNKLLAPGMGLVDRVRDALAGRPTG